VKRLLAFSAVKGGQHLNPSNSRTRAGTAHASILEACPGSDNPDGQSFATPFGRAKTASSMSVALAASLGSSSKRTRNDPIYGFLAKPMRLNELPKGGNLLKNNHDACASIMFQ